MIYPFELTKNTVNANRIIGLIVTIIWLFIGTPQEWIIALFIYVIKGTIASAVIHRRLSHKSYNMNKYLEYFLATIAVAGTNASPISWVAVHRQHHHYADQPNDPHSPLHIPIQKIMLSRFDNINLLYAKDLLKSKFYYVLHKWHWVSTLVVIAILYCIDPRAIIYAWLIPIFLQTFSGSFVNIANHSKLGYRNYDTSDTSYNNILMGYLLFGEGWHNNHHNNPTNPNFGQKWWEFDLGYQMIKIIRK
jgi:stearoyl-CoA desaturase (delta-9 desaturase)